jgi:drug/metabolite transporter (DMT)-like permease
LLTGFAVTILFVLALQTGPVSVVSVINNMRGFFVLLYSTLISFWFPYLLTENVKRHVFYKKLSAIALMLAGVVLLQL